MESNETGRMREMEKEWNERGREVECKNNVRSDKLHSWKVKRRMEKEGKG